MSRAEASAAARPAVLLLHSSASSSRQWDALAAALEPAAAVLAPDLHGHGLQVAWPAERALTLADEAALALPLLEAAGGAHVVGHSYGAAVALHLALQRPDLVRSLVLYEPVLFNLLVAHEPHGDALHQVLWLVERMRVATHRGALEDAARAFVDYWSGEGRWQALPERSRPAVAARMPTVVRHFEACFGEPAPTRQALAALPMPVLCLVGQRSTPAARRIGTLLHDLWPKAGHETMPGLGHMGPVTHAALVNARIEHFLGANDTTVVCSRSPWLLSCSAQERFAGHAEATQ